MTTSPKFILFKNIKTIFEDHHFVSNFLSMQDYDKLLN